MCGQTRVPRSSPSVCIPTDHGCRCPSCASRPVTGSRLLASMPNDRSRAANIGDRVPGMGRVRPVMGGCFPTAQLQGPLCGDELGKRSVKSRPFSDSRSAGWSPRKMTDRPRAKVPGSSDARSKPAATPAGLLSKVSRTPSPSLNDQVVGRRPGGRVRAAAPSIFTLDERGMDQRSVAMPGGHSSARRAQT